MHLLLLRLLGILLFSSVALAQQNFVQLVDPQHYWFEDSNVVNWNNQDRALSQTHDRSLNSLYRPVDGMSSGRPIYFQVQPRFFGGMLLPSAFPNLLTNLQRTSYSFVASTPTTTITQFCTESAAFIAAAPACPIRKKRGIPLDDDIDSSSVVLPVADASKVSSNVQTKREIAILSSRDEETDQFVTGINSRVGRLFFGGSGAVVIVTTLASPVLITAKSTVSSAALNSGTNQLQCIPPGAIVCV